MAMASSRPLLSFSLVLLLCLASTCNAIYEDQVGVRDWCAHPPTRFWTDTPELVNLARVLEGHFHNSVEVVCASAIGK